MLRLTFAVILQLILICEPTLLCAQQASGLQKPIHRLVSLPFAGVTDRAFIKFSPNGTMLACHNTKIHNMIFAPYSTSNLTVTSVESGIRQLNIPEGWQGFAFCPDNKRFLTWDATAVSLWHFSQPEPIAIQSLVNVQEVTFVANGQCFVTRTFESKGLWEAHPAVVTFWDTATLKQIPTPIDQLGPWLDSVVTPDGKLFVGFDKDLKCSILEVATGVALPAPTKVAPGGLWRPGIQVTPDGQYAIFPSEITETDLREAQERQPNGPLQLELVVYWNLVTSKARTLGSVFKTLVQVENEGKEDSLLSRQRLSLYGRLFSGPLPDVYVDNVNKRWVVKDAFSDRVVREFADQTNWKSSDSETINVLKGNRMSLTLNPQSPHPTTYMIDMNSGEILSTFENSLISAYSQNGKFVIVNDQSNNGSFKVWNAETRKTVGLFADPVEHTSGRQVYFSPDNRHFVLSYGSHVDIWSLSQFGEAE